MAVADMDEMEIRKKRKIDSKHGKSKKDVSLKGNKDRTAKTTSDVLLFNSIFEDGLILVKDKRYAKVIAFDDINYQIAREETQMEVFSRYMEIINYFDPTISFQILVRNKKIDVNELKSLITLRRKNDYLDKFRDEFNNVLLRKISEGNNTIVKERYFIINVPSDTPEAARSLLNRIETDVKQLFKTINVETRTLKGKEVAELIYNIISPEDSIQVDYNEIFSSGWKVKDMIAPYYLDFTAPSHFVMNNKYYSVLALRKLSTEMYDNIISDILDLPFSISISIHLQSYDQAKAIELVQAKLKSIRAEIAANQKNALQSGFLPDVVMKPETMRAVEQMEELLSKLLDKNQKLLKLGFYIMVSANTIEELKENIFQIQSVCNKFLTKFTPMSLMQEEGLNTMLPLATDYAALNRSVTTAGASILIPFTTQEIFQPTGLYYGQNSVSKNLIFLDRKKLMNPNGFILGMPGGGKSFSAKREMINVLLKTNDDVIVIDPEREYFALAQLLKGQSIIISSASKQHINPLEISEDYSGDEGPLRLKTDFIMSFFETILGKRYQLSPIHKSYIDRAVNMMYKTLMQYYALPETERVKYKKPQVPTLKDLYTILLSFKDPNAADLALALEPYISGSLDLFAHQTNVDINNRFVVFDIRDLGKQLKTLGMLVILDFIWNRITANREVGKRTWLYIDEIYLLFSNEYSSAYLYELFKRSRKWGAIPTGITQNVEDLLRSDDARAMLSNTEFILLLNQAPNDRIRLAELLNLSEQEVYYITNSPPGSGLIIAGKSRLPFFDEFPKDTQLYSVMTTKPEEVIKYQQKTLEKQAKDQVVQQNNIQQGGKPTQ